MSDNVTPFKPKKIVRSPRTDTPDVRVENGVLFMPKDIIRFDLTIKQVNDLIMGYLADEGLIDCEEWPPGDYPVVVIVRPEEGEEGMSQFFTQYITVPE